MLVTRFQDFRKLFRRDRHNALLNNLPRFQLGGGAIIDPFALGTESEERLQIAKLFSRGLVLVRPCRPELAQRIQIKI